MKKLNEYIYLYNRDGAIIKDTVFAESLETAKHFTIEQLRKTFSFVNIHFLTVTQLRTKNSYIPTIRRGN